MNLKYLKYLINEEVRSFVKEQPTTTPSAPSSTTGTEPEQQSIEEPTDDSLFAGAEVDTPSTTGSPPQASTDPTGAPTDNTTQSTDAQPPSPPEPEKTTEQQVVDIALELTKQTKEIPELLRGVKGAIQDKYDSVESAIPVLQALINSNNPTLKALVPRLEQFLKTKPLR